MINQYPLWKYILIAAILVLATVYGLPNLYPMQAAVQISPISDEFTVNSNLKKQLDFVLQEKKLVFISSKLDSEAKILTYRFEDEEIQNKARDAIFNSIPRGYLITFTRLPTTPGWLAALGGTPMNLGLDLRGGVYFLMDVDMDAAVLQALDRMADNVRSELREADIHYLAVTPQGRDSIYIKLDSLSLRDKASTILRKELSNVLFSESEDDGKGVLKVTLNENGIKEIRDFAVKQNVTTIRKRIDALGVSEPVVQRQGVRRIVVELPGVSDPAQARDILSATATLEFRMVAKTTGPHATTRSTGFKRRDSKATVRLENRVLATGDSITRANAGFDSRSNSPAVFITLDDVGGSRFTKYTKERVGDDMAIVFIEIKKVTKLKDGKPVIEEGKYVKEKVTIKDVISVAQIRDRLGRSFMITGLDDQREAARLAILLQAGALAAPIEIVEERTIGPSLGKANIHMGFVSVMVGFVLVLAFMAVYYRVFGLVANLALLFNLVLIVAIMSMLHAALTLPGIAGIVLTVGMAVDANVLIFERIREEIRNGNTPQSSIQAGYEKALSTIADANITTFIAALVLWLFGTGPIRGFAVTLGIGIATSMFTAIMGTRAVVNIWYGRKRVSKLSI